MNNTIQSSEKYVPQFYSILSEEVGQQHQDVTMRFENDYDGDSSNSSLDEDSSLTTTNSPKRRRRRREAATTAPTRRVSFSPSIRVRKTMNRRSYSREETKSCWFTRDELRRLRNKNYQMEAILQAAGVEMEDYEKVLSMLA